MKNFFSFKKLSMKITFIIGIIILIVAGSVALYMQTRIIEEISRHTKLNLQHQVLDLQEQVNSSFIETALRVDSLRKLAATTFDISEYAADTVAYHYSLGNQIGAFIYSMINLSDDLFAAYFTFSPYLTDGDFVGDIYFYMTEDGIVQCDEPTTSEFYDPDDPDMIWFYGSYNSRQPYWTPVYIDDTGIAMVSYTMPVIIDGQIVGIAGADMAISQIKEQIKGLRLYDTGFALLQDGYGDFFDTNDKVSRLADADKQQLTSVAHSSRGAVFETVLDGVTYMSAVRTLSNGYTLYVMAPKNEVNAEVTASVIRFVIIFITAYAIVLVVAYFIGKPIGARMTVVSSFMKHAIATGDLTLRREDIEARKRYLSNENSIDEIGEVACDLYTLVDTINEMIGDLSTLTRELNEKGDIDYRIDTGHYKGSCKVMVDGINGMVAGIIDDVTEILRGVTALSEGRDANVRMMAGKKAAFTERFNQLERTLDDFVTNLTNVASNAADGNLDIRIDADKYRGGWAVMANELNSVVISVAKPLDSIQKTLVKMADGEFEHMPGSYKGAFHSVQQSVNITVNITLSYIEEIAKLLSAISKGDLTAATQQEYVGSYAPIKTALTVILDSLNSTMGEIKSAASQVLAGAEQISHSASTLAEGTTKQASSIEELNASIEIVNEKTKLNAVRAKEANELSQKSNEHAANSNVEMKTMLTSMESIKASSAQISTIIKVIETIAFQTNLLALNAAVEAARAGEHGKGFSVVAEEVRNLAARSQQSAKETTHQIDESITRVNEGMGMAEGTAVSLETIVADVRQVSGLISQIATLSEEQADSILLINNGISEISSVVQTNSATSEECAAASQELSSQAQMLQQLVSFFKLK